MINTLNIKEQQLKNGYFETGDGPEKILIMGSCRVCPLVNYIDIWNRTIGENRFTIYSIDPFNWNYHPITNEFVNIQDVINGLEKDEKILSVFKSVDIFIHEWYQNYGMFNIFKEGEKNIYQFGMDPKMDIMLPNWNDIFVLFSDFYHLDREFRDIADYEYKEFGRLTPDTQLSIATKAKNNLNKFCDVCLKSDIPEMSEYVISNIKTTRFFWNFNHISKAFSLKVFQLINEKFLHLPVTISFLEELESTDMFKDVFTPLTEYDVISFGFDWNEPVINFKTYNNIQI